MPSASLLFFLLMLSSIRVGKSAESFIKLKCEPVVGVIGQTTTISCSTESEKKAVINTVVITKSREKKPCFVFHDDTVREDSDPRFKFDNLPSLQLHNTMISDEGVYFYKIRTTIGDNDATFTINVTAKYNNPVMTSVPEEIVNDEHVDLHCSASGGYPAGTIYWFDQSNTNWTKSSTLQSTLGDDGRFTLSSKLSFSKIDSLWAPFKCVVLNNRYGVEGEIMSTMKIIEKPLPSSKETEKSVKNNNIVACVVVIGSLIIGLLIALLFKRRRDQRIRRTSSCPMLSASPTEHTYTEENEVLKKNVVKDVGDSEMNIAV